MEFSVQYIQLSHEEEPNVVKAWNKICLQMNGARQSLAHILCLGPVLQTMKLFLHSVYNTLHLTLLLGSDIFIKQRRRELNLHVLLCVYTERYFPGLHLKHGLNWLWRIKIKKIQDFKISPGTKCLKIMSIKIWLQLKKRPSTQSPPHFLLYVRDLKSASFSCFIFRCLGYF